MFDYPSLVLAREIIRVKASIKSREGLIRLASALDETVNNRTLVDLVKEQAADVSKLSQLSIATSVLQNYRTALSATFDKEKA